MGADLVTPPTSSAQQVQVPAKAQLEEVLQRICQEEEPLRQLPSSTTAAVGAKRTATALTGKTLLPLAQCVSLPLAQSLLPPLLQFLLQVRVLGVRRPQRIAQMLVLLIQ